MSNYRNENYSSFAYFQISYMYLLVYISHCVYFLQFSIRNLPMKSFPQNPIGQVSGKFQRMGFQGTSAIQPNSDKSAILQGTILPSPSHSGSLNDKQFPISTLSEVTPSISVRKFFRVMFTSY